MKLRNDQIEAINKMHNGCILCGDTGSGKSITSIAYYYLLHGGKIFEDHMEPMTNPKNLYIITTAAKRDKHEWEVDLGYFGLEAGKGVTIDSWNNIKKYTEATASFFIFDEQRLVGSGAWVKAFYKIARSNLWILLSATPGDRWDDYIPVFVANGFYKNKSAFLREHAIFNRFSKYPKIDKFINEGKLLYFRRHILVPMDFKKPTVPHHEYVVCKYDILKYKQLNKIRWNIWTDEPMENAGELCYCLRRVCNEDDSRIAACLELAEVHPRIIIFYNFNYELEILKGAAWPEGTVVSEWNGHNHDILPGGKRWVYLVQYTAGSEGWNCITTDTIIFYSQNYSYRATIQAAGRIDRANTPYVDLWYYHLESKAAIDIAIKRALVNKKNFNEKKYVGEWR